MPDYADSNRVDLRFIEEATWGDTPTGPNVQKVNYTGEGLRSDQTTVTSETIRSDRNVSDHTVVGGGASGDVNFELRYSAEFERLASVALHANWVSTRVSGAGASAAFSGGTVDVGSGLAASVLSGHIFRISNATTSSNDGDYRVLANVTAGNDNTLTLAEVSSGATAVFSDEAFGASTLLMGNNIRNGVLKKSVTFEKHFADIDEYHTYAGMRGSTMTLSLESAAILTGTFGFQGKSQALSSVTVASATSEQSTNTVMNSSGNVGRIWYNGSIATGICFQSAEISLDNNARDQQCVGSDVNSGIGLGNAAVTGNFSAFYLNNDILDNFVNKDNVDFRFQVTDLAGNSYVFDVARIRLTEATANAEGANQDVVQNISFGAFVSETGNYTIQVTALDA